MPTAASNSKKEKPIVRRIRREGSSLIVTLPKDLCANFSEGDFVVIRQVGTALELRPYAAE